MSGWHSQGCHGYSLLSSAATSPMLINFVDELKDCNTEVTMETQRLYVS